MGGVEEYFYLEKSKKEVKVGAEMEKYKKIGLFRVVLVRVL